MVKTDEIQKGWRQAMDLVREQSKIIHTSREIIADYQDHLSVCITKSVDECIICRDFMSSLEDCLSSDDGRAKANKEELAIQQNLATLFGTDKLCVSIFFDNPQLSKTVSLQEGMEVILETFMTKTAVKILFGRVVYSGDYDPSIVKVHPSRVRGGDVIVAEVTELISGELSLFPFRVVDGIKELQLRGCDVPDVSRQRGNISLQDIEAFFGPCSSRVDVILDPIQHDNYKFYPYYEGARKMAPQFRSRGIGYVRLGDDMSNFGTAFLSVDHGRSFLDRGANDQNILSQGDGGSNSLMSQTMQNTKPQDNRMATLRSQTEFSRSMPLMNKNQQQLHLPGSNTPQPPPPTVFYGNHPNTAPPPTIRATSAGTCDGSVASYGSVPNSAVSMYSSSPSSVPSGQKKKLTDTLRRIVSVNRSQSDLSLNVPDANAVDSSYMDDDDDATAVSSLPTPKQLLPSSPSAQQLEEAIASFETSMQQEGSAAWRVKVEVVKRLQADFELAAVHIAEQLRPATVLRFLDGLREQLIRTQNPQLTVALLELIPVLASRLRVGTNATDSAVMLSWRRVLTDMIQLLRNNNRQIEMAASRFMLILTQVGIRAITWSLLCDILEPILGLPSFNSLGGSSSAAAIGTGIVSTKAAGGSGATSGSGASSTGKAVGKLNKVMDFVDQWLIADLTIILSKGSLPVTSSTITSDELLRLTRAGLIAVKDRDEKTRTAGMQVVASLAVADFVVNRGSASASSSIPSVHELAAWLSAGVSSWLQDELDRTNLPRSKLAPFFTKSLENLPGSTSVLPVAGSSGSNSSTAGSSSSSAAAASTTGSGKHSGGFSASLKARKLTPSQTTVKASNGTNPQPPGTSSTGSLSSVVVSSPGRASTNDTTGQVTSPLGTKMMQLRLQEAQLLLKREPQSDAEWLGVQEVIDMADIACTEVEGISKQHQVPLGNLLRVLLPFTEQTSTLDQTISVVGGDWKQQLQQDVQTHLPHLTHLQPQLLSHSQTLRKLRGLVRVKIADQSDFRQARAAVHTLKDFLQDYTATMELS